ncbi:MAG: helix-turn-helix domain-containing protein [Christensenellaceae bacterium]|nr:helix-turn-helix domain-containing protein [Christensenellaceae bacterium]
MVLKTLREARGLSQEDLAKAIGVRQSTVGMWENGKNKPKYNTLLKLAAFFDVDVNYLVGEEQKDRADVLRVPVLGHVAAGIPIEAIEDIIGYEELPAASFQDGEYFGLRIKGDSMEPRIKEGDVVIVRRQPDVGSGEVAVVIVNGHEATVKRVVKHDNGITLISFNSAYPPKFFTCNEVLNLPVEIIGKVVELRGKF